MGKQLPSGLYITDEGLRTVADRLAKETFYQEDASLRDAFYYAAIDDLIRETPAEFEMTASPTDDDINVIFDEVRTVAYSLLDGLRACYGSLYEKHIAYHTW